MPTQLFISDFSSDTRNGTINDDFIIAIAGFGSTHDTLNGLDGDDFLLGDSSAPFTSGTSNSMMAPFNIDNTETWTIDENPFFGDDSVPHISLYIRPSAGEELYSSVTVGAGQTITIDIDFGEHAIGGSTDVIVALFDSGAVQRAQDDDGFNDSADGAGSVSISDSFLVFTNMTGVTQTYTIRFREFDGNTFEGDESFIANISVTGHAVTMPTVMGNDVLTGGIGDDQLAGQGGNDTLLGEAGNDTLFGGSGDDIINGGAGIDLVSYAEMSEGVVVDLSQSEQNTLGAGYDTLLGIENLTATAFDDIITGNSAANQVLAGAGNDTVNGGNGNDSLFGEAGDDMLTGGSGSDSLYGDDGNNTLFGGDGHDNLQSGTGNDLLSGASGNDQFSDTAGNDVIDGGAGTDTVNYSFSGSVTVNLSITTLQNTGGAGFDRITGIENLNGSFDPDTLLGNAAANILQGGSGNDVLNGASGNDTLNGGGNDDTIEGSDGIDTASYASAAMGVTVSLAAIGAQNTLGDGVDSLSNIENVIGSVFADTLTGSTGVNTLLGGIGNDTLNGGDANDTLFGEANDDTLNGGSGNDTASYLTATGAVTVSLAIGAAQNTGGAGTDTLNSIERLVGSAFADTLTGNGGVNVLTGGGANDVINAAADNDLLYGGTGNDVLIGGAGNDTITGDSGEDTASYAGSASAVTVTLTAGDAQNTLGAGLDMLVSIERLTGSGFNDTLTGNAGANILSGEAGADTLNGGAGDDTLIGGAGVDTASYAGASAGINASLATDGSQATGGSGFDTLLSIESLIGSNFSDGLFGNGLANTINGGQGNDFIGGRGGNDTLTGGTGTDSFYFGSALNAATNVDNITDFSVADDSFDLEQLIFTQVGPVGTLAAAAFRIGAAAADASDRIIYNSATGNIYYDADGSGAGAQILFAHVTAGLALTNADFIISID